MFFVKYYVLECDRIRSNRLFWVWIWWRMGREKKSLVIVILGCVGLRFFYGFYLKSRTKDMCVRERLRYMLFLVLLVVIKG